MICVQRKGHAAFHVVDDVRDSDLSAELDCEPGVRHSLRTIVRADDLAHLLEVLGDVQVCPRCKPRMEAGG